MQYSCMICNYTSRRKVDLERHQRRKVPCTSENYMSYRVQNELHEVQQNINVIEQNINAVEQNINAVEQNINVVEQNINVVEQNINVGRAYSKTFRCNRCGRHCSSSQRLKSHEDKCDGLDKKQCKVCLKLFKSNQGKYQHTLYVKCVPPGNATNIHNTTINDNSTNITNNNQQYITNNIRLCFGNEMLEKLCKEDGYMKRIEEYVKLLKYALPKALEDVYFNENHPNNQTIKKDRRNDNLVSIHVGENRWEKRYAKDMITTTLEKLHDYMEKYIEDVKLTPMRRRNLQAFGKEMSKLKYWTTHSIEDKLEIDDFPETTEEDMKKEAKVVSKLLTDKMYERKKL